MKTKVHEIKDSHIRDLLNDTVVQIENEYTLDLPQSVIDHMGLKPDDTVAFILNDNGDIVIKKQ